MKKNSLLWIMLMIPMMTIYAQTPEKINYQAAARDINGNPLVNQSISVKFSILSSSATGTAQYVETHTTNTDNLGMFSLQIGGGTIVSGSFANISWGSATHFLKIEIDTSGGTNYTWLGTSQLLSVPYALQAKKVEQVSLKPNSYLTSDSNENTTLGISLPAASLAEYNTLIGSSAGSASMSGDQNTLIGHRSGQSITTANHSVFLGTLSGNLNTSGSFNTFIGLKAGKDNLIGGSNTLIGSSAGQSMTGSYNVALGTSSGYSNSTGFGNVFLGTNSGFNNNGFKNVFIGFGAGQNVTGNEKFVLANGPVANDEILSGDFLTGDLKVRGQLETGTGIKFSDGSTLTTAASSGSILGVNIDATNTSLGTSAGVSNSAVNNTFVGRLSGNANTTAVVNTFVGALSGQSNTTGFANTFLGSRTARFNTTGNENTVIGESAGTNNNGSNNTIIGVSAGFENTTASNNVFLGSRSGRNNTTGDQNTFLGTNSGFSKSTGSGNVYMGYNSGYNNTAGSGNVFLGYEAGYDENGSDQLVIANGKDSSNVLLKGDFNSGNLSAKGSIESKNGGFVFPDGSVQTTAAGVNLVKSKVEYVDFGAISIIGNTINWTKGGSSSIQVPSTGKIIITYTGYIEYKKGNEQNTLAQIGVGLTSQNTPLNSITKISVGRYVYGTYIPFTSKFVYNVTSAGVYSFSLFMKASIIGEVHVNNLTLHYIPD